MFAGIFGFPYLGCGPRSWECVQPQVRKSRRPRPSPASTTKSKPTRSSARRPSPLSRPHKATEGSSGWRVKFASNSRSQMMVVKPRRSAQADMARVFFWLMRAGVVRIDVLSLDGVMISTSCKTRERLRRIRIGKKTEPPHVSLSEMSQAHQPQPRGQVTQLGLACRVGQPIHV